MTVVDIREAMTRLSRLIAEAAAGDAFFHPLPEKDLAGWE